MNRWNKLIVGTCVAGFMFLLPSGYGAASLPYAQGFDGSWTPSGDWSAGGSGVAQSGGAGDFIETALGAGGVVVSNDMLTLSIASSPQISNSWFQIWAKPVAGTSDPASMSGVTGAFYVKTNGALMVYGTNWSQVATGLPTSGWIGFVVHADYANQKWDIYYSTSYGAPLTKANTSASVPFATGASNRLSSISIESGGRAAVDAVGVSKAFAPVSGPGTPSKVAAKVFAVGSSADLDLPVYSDTYTNGAGNNLLSGALGKDLLTGLGLSGSDYVLSRHTQPDNEWNGYVVSGNSWTEDTTGYPNTVPIGSMPIQIVTKLWYTKASASSMGFFAYNTALARDGTVTPAASGYSEIATLNGTSGGKSGFTALSAPKVYTDVNALPFSLFPGAAGLTYGDFLYVTSPSDSARLIQYYWNNTQWMEWARPPSSVVPAGADMWLKRAASGTGTATFLY